MCLGFAVIVLPVVTWLATSAGWESLWREVIVRPVAMTNLQSLPVPAFELPTRWTRWEIRASFVSLQFRLYVALYAGYAAVLGWQLVRAVKARRPFPSSLLLAVVVWGGIFFVRSFGRADEAHLDSALPVSCLLLAYAVCIPLKGALERPGLVRHAASLGLVAVFGSWVFLTGVDPYLLDPKVRGWVPVTTLSEVTKQWPETRYSVFDQIVREMRVKTVPGETVLDLTSSSLLHVVSRRHGPGWADVVMPGSFLSPEEERFFVAKLERSPPAMVINPTWEFDDMPSRAVENYAPELDAWVHEQYEVYLELGDFELMLPKHQRSLSTRWLESRR